MLRKIHTSLNEFINYDIPEITPYNIRKSKCTKKRLNLVIPSINREHLFGGILTALKFFNILKKRFNNKLTFRIILNDASPDEISKTKFSEYTFSSNEEDLDIDNIIIPFNDRYNKTIPIGKNDIFIATSWWTAYVIQKAILQQSKLYKQPPQKLIYFIQDYEPGFYPWSSRYLLALSTYQNKAVKTLAVFNSDLLQEYFHHQGLKFYKEYYFNPKLNINLKKHIDNLKSFNKKKQIIFYGRPNIGKRNCFEIIIKALEQFIQSKENIKDWTIFSVGEKHDTIRIGSIKIESLGKLSLEGYASLLKETAIGISLMMSPHPSYPPLEMAHFGALTITNHYANKDLSKWHDNLFSLTNASPENITNTLLELTTRFEKNPKSGLKGESKVPFYTDDSEQFGFIDKLIKNI